MLSVRTGGGPGAQTVRSRRGHRSRRSPCVTCRARKGRGPAGTPPPGSGSWSRTRPTRVRARLIEWTQNPDLGAATRGPAVTTLASYSRSSADLQVVEWPSL